MGGIEGSLRGLHLSNLVIQNHVSGQILARIQMCLEHVSDSSQEFQLL